MFYLFTNHFMGRGFIESFVEICQQHDHPGTVVLSGRNWMKLRGFKHLKYKARQRAFARRLRKKHGISVCIEKNINALSFQRQIGPKDKGLVAGFDQIFKADLIQRFDSLVNMHASILPYYRGPIPTYWKLKNAEKMTGITLHKVAPEIDAGEIIYQTSINIDPEIKEFVLRKQLWKLARKPAERWMRHCLTGEHFERRVLNADQIYRVKAGYQSYPQKE